MLHCCSTCQKVRTLEQKPKLTATEVGLDSRSRLDRGNTAFSNSGVGRCVGGGGGWGWGSTVMFLEIAGYEDLLMATLLTIIKSSAHITN